MLGYTKLGLVVLKVERLNTLQKIQLVTILLFY